MHVVLYLYVCLYLCQIMERKLNLYELQCILVILIMCHILCYIIMLFGVMCISLLILVRIF